MLSCFRRDQTQRSARTSSLSLEDTNVQTRLFKDRNETKFVKDYFNEEIPRELGSHVTSELKLWMSVRVELKRRC